MTDVSNKIREEAGKLLEKGEVDVIIGFEKGSIPLSATPCFIRNEADIEKLIWNEYCGNNLSLYLSKARGKIGIIAKGCDTRAIVELIKEKQVQRERIVIIGVPCEGMLDRKRIMIRCQSRNITGIEDQGRQLLITGDSLNVAVEKDEFFYPACQVCANRNPVMCDVFIGNTIEEQKTDEFTDVTDFNEKPSEERWAYITDEIDRCIRCYACRNACPLCYCKECFVDATQPQWVGKTIEQSDTLSFHIMRSIHLAGRCIECGACERACPVMVDIRKLNRKMSADVKNMFGYKTGLDIDQPAPLSVFKPDDSEEFILDI
ncbi:MAG: 4Fe-4S ferredoxin [Candidatus Aegiribacteria sp.]|nr:4Fe-4S ferredoxin [Candidatus Aegiribacteria sp.]